MRLFLLIMLLFSMTLASDHIEIYDAYTNGKRVIVEGRVVDIKDKKTKSSKVLSSFFNDEKKEVELYLMVNQLSFRGQSDDEGYFTFDIEVTNLPSCLVSIETNDENSFQKLELHYPNSSRHIGIISDFDDTVIVSNVTSKTKLLYNTFVKNYKEREVVEEVKEKIFKLYQAQKDTALFFVTGSPHQLQNNIHNFLDYHEFPKRTILSKKIHGSNADSLLASIEYKYNKIVKLITMYPHISWVMFGDSGEKDREIYLKVLKDYPNNVSAVYIRDVESKELKKLF